MPTRTRSLTLAGSLAAALVFPACGGASGSSSASSSATGAGTSAGGSSGAGTASASSSGAVSQGSGNQGATSSGGGSAGSSTGLGSSTGSAAGSSTGLAVMGSIVTLAGGGPGQGRCEGTPFDAVYHLAMGLDGKLYVLGGGIFRVDTDTGAVSMVLDDYGQIGFGGLAVTPAGSLLLVQSEATGDPNVPYAEAISTLGRRQPVPFVEATPNACSHFSPDGGHGFTQIGGMTFDDKGTLYVSNQDLVNTHICKVAPDGTVSILAGSGNHGYREGSPAIAAFYNPGGLAADRDGNLYVADSTNNRIRKVSPDGTASTWTGSGQPGFTDGYPSQSSFDGPVDLVLDARQNLYVVDEQNNAIRMVTSGGKTITLQLVDETTGAVGLGGFSYPMGIAIDASGRLFVADYWNCAVKRITLFDGGSTLAFDGGVDGGNQEDGGDCGAAAQKLQFASCTRPELCGCGLRCVVDSNVALVSTFIPPGGPEYCEQECSTSAECRYETTGCINGLCAMIVCGAETGNGVIGSTCSMGDDAVQGTCVPLESDAGVGLCHAPGTATLGEACLPVSQSFQLGALGPRQNAGEYCAAGGVCWLDAGVVIPICVAQCEDAGLTCPGQDTCVYRQAALGGLCLETDGGP